MLPKRKIILASASPRRQYLLKELGLQFTVDPPHIDESFPADMPVEKVPSYLAEKKAKELLPKITEEVVIASDTVVILEHQILNKPVDRTDAIAMLNFLSGKTHTVITAVCILSKSKVDSFEDRTNVTFKNLSKTEIEYYVDNYKPFDKAGAYGAQDCLPAGVNPCSKEEMDFLESISKTDLVQKTLSAPKAGAGMVGIEKISGSYFTVMGLPIDKVYEHLKLF